MPYVWLLLNISGSKHILTNSRQRFSSFWYSGGLNLQKTEITWTNSRAFRGLSAWDKQLSLGKWREGRGTEGKEKTRQQERQRRKTHNKKGQGERKLEDEKTSEKQGKKTESKQEREKGNEKVKEKECKQASKQVSKQESSWTNFTTFYTLLGRYICCTKYVTVIYHIFLHVIFTVPEVRKFFYPHFISQKTSTRNKWPQVTLKILAVQELTLFSPSWML